MLRRLVAALLLLSLPAPGALALVADASAHRCGCSEGICRCHARARAPRDTCHEPGGGARLVAGCGAQPDAFRLPSSLDAVIPEPATPAREPARLDSGARPERSPTTGFARIDGPPPRPLAP
jgi:hypothetical protein